MDQERIGKLIKEIRTNNKLSQNDFAKKYGVTYQAVSKWETGKNIPDIQILKQICSDYNISLDNLLEGNKNSLKETKKIFIIGMFGRKSGFYYFF
jgi:transcriptional regulator with XRE-family HTH domain